MPLVGCICLNYAIGGRIGGLTLGVVDYEIASFDDCLNQTATEVRREGLDCLVRKASCRFINEFDDDVASKVCANPIYCGGIIMIAVYPISEW